MLSTKLIVELIIATVYGIMIGFISIKMAYKMASKRSEDPLQPAILNQKKIKIVVVILTTVASVALVLTQTSTGLLIRNLALLLPIFAVSAVDSVVRKIPNSMLLSMIGIQVAYATYYCISEKSAVYLTTCGFGFFIGFAACSIPSLLKIPVGAGDIKFSGVIGLCIAFMGYFQSMVLMAVFVLVYYIILKIKKQGSMRTQIPMGPFLSAGTVITMCFPFIEQYAGNIGNMF